MFGLFWAAVFALAFWVVGDMARDKAVLALSEQTRIDANLNTALLRAVLDKQRALPLVLSKDKALEAALLDKTATTIDPLNEKLEALADGTQAAVIYLVGMDGIAIAASNWRGPTSFVGNDYKFRPYFHNALKNGDAEYFALGNVSNRPGLYISRRIDGPSGPLGVIVVKLEFDRLESDWNNAGRPTFVTDERNIVLITSLPSWRFMTIGSIDQEQLQSIRDSLQFGDAPLKPLPLSIKSIDGEDVQLIDALLPGNARNTDFLAIRSIVPSTPWQMYSLAPIRPQIPSAIRESRLFTFIILSAIATVAGLLLRRRQKIATRIANAQRTQMELEERVEERTRDLSLARDRLQAEISDHRRTETMLQGVQQDLVHANRLAIMGQVAAGVAHEINQPVATIRAYADNAKTFIERKRLSDATENLSEIAALTDRIGTITGDLKALARKGRTPSEPTSLSQVISGALVLLRSRFSGRMDQLDIALPPPELQVIGHSIRLEQVFINLFQNALEAIDLKQNDGKIEVRTHVDRDKVIISVSDNGPGMPQHIRDNLFSPFNTSKEKGLGLGLVIVKEIVTDYGGAISAESNAAGTSFRIELRKA
ncbi:sensor histidine kinase [Brucella anthropi]|uniref:ATP-binding protein n=1 Tax=Ochrobactrum sp. BTU2 TaxID=2856166 RepID=UPI0002E4E044|nr:MULTISPECIES: ATP-binding protein [Brucella/Ochrobactrum group]KAB2741995.1 sensor histidine kinase [Brucella anthropi]KAB2744740.1 sensor histidine kinase [Brucella anthropi]KAB2754541.1 sensor histidine kinase [Brucella anthropi]KAB2765205.1 sensor histidine kinase [Brucella anthropi]KAB2781409.1 sensor histidine kinase [Brucella anthropi]